MELYEFQRQYLNDLPSKFIFSCETGTGKTLMALEHYKKYGYPNKLLILAPAAKMRTGDWQRHVAEVFPDESTRPDVYYYSYEKFTRNVTPAEYNRGKKSIWREWLSKYGESIICDELHRAANPTSGIGIRVFLVSQNMFFFIGLTATPLPNGWISAANYFKIFGFSKNITEFKKRYCNYQTYKGFPELISYNREDELKRIWNKISKPLLKSDALDLPELVTIPVDMPIPKAYTETRVNYIFGDKVLDNPSAYLHALRQSTMEGKLPWLNEFVDGVSSNIVIFYNYIAERDAILKMLKKSHPKRTVFRIDGAKHEEPKPSIWGNLKRTITLAQYQSGSTGIELQYADTIVFFSPTYSYILYYQSLGRIERIGQKNSMTVYELCAGGTIESDIWQALKNKKDFSDKIWLESNKLTK